MELLARHVAPAVWSNIAEPGDTWAGALRRQLGVERALQWAIAPFSPLPDEVEAPGGEMGAGALKGWRTAHGRWSTRLETYDYRKDLDALEKMGGRLIFPGDEEWPSGLNHLEDRMPPALWVVGNIRGEEDSPNVSIVGSRAATQYGTKLAGQIAFDLAESGVIVVSGGAYGIDAAAHRGALDALTLRHLEERTVRDEDKPPTIAIICGGLSNLYPPGNRRLFDRILVEGGGIVAEVPPSFRPARWRFLERNRLIAAWSEVTLVVEAGVRSGALATANRAADLGREVAAVPGPVTSPSSKGPHILLREGATLVEDASDVLAIVNPSATGDLEKLQNHEDKHEGLPGVNSQTARVLHTLTPLAQRVWEALPLMGAAPSNSVAQVAGVTEDEAGSGLLSLHIVGLAKCEDDKWRRAV